MSRLPVDDPSHRGIIAQSLGVVDIFVSRKPPNTACRNVPSKACRRHRR